MKKDEIKKNYFEFQYCDASQLAIKLIMNSIYGATAAPNIYNSFLINIASEITKKARNQLFSLFMYSYSYCWNNNMYGLLDVVYGDTVN